MDYDPEKIEPKRQKYWDKEKLYQAKDFDSKPKQYILVEFPYPSGDGLHVGHCRSYTGLDVISRKKRMQGFNVMYPMGWDAFGLPSENYAVKTGIHPKITTKQNGDNFKRQLKMLGFSFDWSREINTTDPKYYKWTQWIFVQMFKQGLAYKAKIAINWCLSCKIGLANEEVVEGRCERCKGPVEKREKEQWMLRITKYADRLIKDLDMVDYPERVKALQKDWIGKSVGAQVDFKIKDSDQTLKVFTTRPDTLFGASFMVLSPEHPLVASLLKSKIQIPNVKEIEKYIEQAKKKSDLERTDLIKEKTGVELQGIKAINPVNNKEIPIWVADYVLMSYGFGAIMAVPGHDQRDWEFAKKYGLEIIPVVKGGDIEKQAFADINKGEMINSGQFNGLRPDQCVKKITQWLEQKNLGKKAVNYKLHDWVFSRQRYWGEPIPMIYCEKCGWQAVAEKDLPIELPDIKEFKPLETGEPPLAKADKWINAKCPKCAGPAKRETDVMPNWAGSNWYFLRYCDPKNDKELASAKSLKYWAPVDWYNGGMEHTTLHLLYSRFVYKFLWDIQAVPEELGPEPYKKRTCHGIILGEGGIKMSKSKGNVINPDDIVEQYGADALRLYQMFMGPFSQTIAWDNEGVRGVSRFLKKVFKLFSKIKSQIPNPNDQTNSKSQIPSSKLEKLFHQTIKKVGEDIDNMKFNTAVAQMMIMVNEMEKQKQISREIFEKFLIILSPFAPYIAEELWHKLGNKNSIFLQNWPEYDKQLIREEKINLIIQVNGKVRDRIEVEPGISENHAKQIALASKKTEKWLDNKQPQKVIFIKDKLINIVL